MADLFLIAMAFFNAAGLLLIKASAQSNCSFWQKFRSRRLIFGLLCMMQSPLYLALAANGTTLSRMNAFSSLSYVFIMLATWLFLREKLDIRKIVGSVFIVIGILVLK